MTSHYAQVPVAARDYFTRHPDGRGMPDHPVIARQYRPGRGWTQYPIRKRVSGAWLRKMLNQDGATEVTLACGGREADFRITELLSRAVRPTQQQSFAEYKAAAAGDDPDIMAQPR